MPVGDKVDKISKVNLFNSRVVDYAVSRIQFHSGSPAFGQIRPAGAQMTGDLTTIGAHSTKPNNFVNVEPLGGRITASDLAMVFQSFTYNLTAIRRANVRKLTSYYRWAGGSPQRSTFATIAANNICAMAAHQRMAITTFRARVTAAPNPMPSLEPGNVASELSLNNLIERLRSIIAGRMAEPAINTSVCHNSCHSSCHSSRGRR